MSLKRFTNPEQLRALGRPLLKKFFGKFSSGPLACEAKLPLDSVDDDEYFEQLAKMFLDPKDPIPPEMLEVLYAVVEMASEAGVERLTKAAKLKGLKIEWDKKSSDLDIVVQIWLENPTLMAEQHNEHRLLAMTSFQYWGSKTPPHERLPFTSPTEEIVKLIRKAADDWCRENHCGEDGVTISSHHLDAEWWFLIRRGGTMSRLATLEGRKSKILLYRPGKDDVVVYNVERDELRIHSRSKGIRELYRTEFGTRLRGDSGYFSQQKNFVLAPLREDLKKALDPEGIPDIKAIVLQEIEMAFGGDFDDRLIRKSDDMVKSATSRSKEGDPVKVIKDGGTLVRAGFQIEFTNSKKPRKVHLRPPDELRVGRHGDLKAVHAWLNARRFRAAKAE